MDNSLVPSGNGKSESALVPATLADDQLLAVAEAAEKRIAAVNKIKGLALRVTNHQDWTDQGGKPYLQVSGSEKVARLFGISWRLDEPTREEHEDGHFSYTFKGYFNMGAAEIEVVGTRSSSDPFFGGGKSNRKPPSEIDRNDVKKGAMTNCIGNGISRLLGIRNLTWDEVKSGGVQQSQVSKVDYKTSKPAEPPPTDRYTGEQIKQEEKGVGDNGYPVSLPPKQAHDAPPAQSGAELAKHIADGMDETYEDGMIGNLQPYQGTKAYQKGCSPGYFDLEDGQGGLVRKFKYMDPSMDITSGLKRVYYRTENFKGKVSFAVTKIEPLD